MLFNRSFKNQTTIIRHYPQHFKQLTVLAVKFPNGRPQVFNHNLTPNVEVALACRASASIPVILEPVEIKIDGGVEKFVDGGMLDNLPTDYFDSTDKGTFLENQKPEQTLVFAFGEGLSAKKNPVYQALYGARWDDAMTDRVVDEILDSVLRDAKKIITIAKPHSANDKINILNRTLATTLKRIVQDGRMHPNAANIFSAAVQSCFSSILLSPDKHQEFWHRYDQEINSDIRLRLLGGRVKNRLIPTLYQAGTLEKLKRNKLVEKLGGLKTPYRNTKQKETGYQKLRAKYALRTVELRVGDIKTTHFDKAEKLSRMMDTLGFLDTVNYICNHELHDPKLFNETQFYCDIVRYYEQILTGVKSASQMQPGKDDFNHELQSLKRTLTEQGCSVANMNRQICLRIKDQVERKLDSFEAFALSRAVELYNQQLTPEQLFKEVYLEGFKREAMIAVSKISNEKIHNYETLRRMLNDKNMFHLHLSQPSLRKETRIDNVFAALKKLSPFAQAFTVAAKNYQIENTNQESNAISASFLLNASIGFSFCLSVAAFVVAALALTSIVYLPTFGIGLAVGMGVVFGVAAYGLFKKNQQRQTDLTPESSEDNGFETECLERGAPKTLAQVCPAL